MKEYLQIYMTLENEIKELSYSITFSEERKSVYSPKIAELVLRAAGLLESASKYLYVVETQKSEPNYDSDKLISKLDLKDRGVYIYWDLYQCEKNCSCLTKKMNLKLMSTRLKRKIQKKLCLEQCLPKFKT